MDLKFLRLPHGEGLPLPSYATEGAAGLDIRAAEDVTLFHGDRRLIRTGFAVEVPSGYEMQVRSRSGLAAKHGAFVLNGVGTIDEDYRGEIFVLLGKLGHDKFEIQRGERIAQLVLAPVTRASAVEASGLSSTVRGDAGIGSTGTR